MDRPLIEEPVMQTSDQAPKRCGGLMKAGVCALVVLALVVGAGYFFGVGSSLRGLVRAADGGVGTDAQRRVADSLVKTLHAQTALYKLQHNDNYPDFAKYPNWEQITKFTDTVGKINETKTRDVRYGPYMQSVPKNPLNGLSTLAVVAGPVNVGDATPNGQKAGFVFETVKGQFFVTDTSGTKVIDPNVAQ